MLSKDEIDKLLAQANAKIDNNTSNLTRTSDAQLSSGGLSLGETILASAAGAILGSWIGSKLFGNQNSKQIAKAHIKIQVPTQEVWIALISKKRQILLQEVVAVRADFSVVAQSQALAHQALEAENDKFKKKSPH